MLYGIPEEEGLRCPYHGWMFNGTGQCIEMPAEAPDSTFPSRVKMPGYSVQELCGLIFAYLGPEPVPLLPRWDMFVWDNVLRDIGATIIPCNWLQIMENSLEPVGGTAAFPITCWNGWGVRIYSGDFIVRARMGWQAAWSTRKSASTSFSTGSLNDAWSPAGRRRIRNGASGIPSCSRTSCAWAAISSIASQWMTRTPCMCGLRPIHSHQVRRRPGKKNPLLSGAAPDP
jgi:phenylpropionate dioxygenase-like ring-hydroxylating dioxygenase large terminal subunit